MLGPFATASRLTPIHQVSLAVLSRAACASMSTTTTTTHDRGDCYGPMEWAHQPWNNVFLCPSVGLFAHLVYHFMLSIVKHVHFTVNVLYGMQNAEDANSTTHHSTLMHGLQTDQFVEFHFSPPQKSQKTVGLSLIHI